MRDVLRSWEANISFVATWEGPNQAGLGFCSFLTKLVPGKETEKFSRGEIPVFISEPGYFRWNRGSILEKNKARLRMWDLFAPASGSSQTPFIYTPVAMLGTPEPTHLETLPNTLEN